MAKKAGRSGKEVDKGRSSVPLGFEAQLWAAADALRNNMDAAEYKDGQAVLNEAFAPTAS